MAGLGNSQPEPGVLAGSRRRVRGRAPGRDGRADRGQRGGHSVRGRLHKDPNRRRRRAGPDVQRYRQRVRRRRHPVAVAGGRSGSRPDPQPGIRPLQGNAVRSSYGDTAAGLVVLQQVLVGAGRSRRYAEHLGRVCGCVRPAAGGGHHADHHRRRVGGRLRIRDLHVRRGISSQPAVVRGPLGRRGNLRGQLRGSRRVLPAARR